MDPVLAEVWNLGIKRLLEQRPFVCESGNGGTSGTTPDDQVLTVRLSGSEVKRDLRNLVCWTSNVLDR